MEDPNFRIRLPRLAADSPIIKEILNNAYGIEAARINLLTGYDDLNFKLADCTIIGEENVNTLNSQKFTLKFTNLWEARFYPELCDAQIEMSEILLQNGINCPQIIPRKDESRRRHSIFQFTLDDGQKVLCPLRLSTYIPGRTIEEWFNREGESMATNPGIADHLANKVGHLLGLFHSILDRNAFCPQIFRQYCPLIALECWPQLRREFQLQTHGGMANGWNLEKKIMCEQIFDKFTKLVLNRSDQFQRGLIHSDFNECNILLSANANANANDSSTSSFPGIVGLLDFGDCHYSFRVADLANSILYFYLLLRQMEDPKLELLKRIAKCIYSGYSLASASAPHERIPPFDLYHLRLFLQARLVSSLVYALRTIRIEKMEGERQQNVQQPQSIDYVMKTQQKGWTLLKELMEDDKDVPILILPSPPSPSDE